MRLLLLLLMQQNWLSLLCLFRYLHGLGGSGPRCGPSGGDLAETRSRAALQLLSAQTHHEHQENSASWISAVLVSLRPLKVVCVTGLWGPSDLSWGPEQGEGPAVAWWRSSLLLQPCDLQSFQTGGGLVHWLLNDRERLDDCPQISLTQNEWNLSTWM